MKIYFAGFHEADLPGVLPVIDALSRQGKWLPVVVPGSYYESGTGIRTASLPRRVATVREPLDAAELRTARQRGRKLLNEARQRTNAGASPHDATSHALHTFVRRPEMASLFSTYAAIEMAAEKIAVLERPSVVILPEDSDYLRGRLLARIFRQHGSHLVCLPPWYYGTFVSYPLIGKRYAHTYLVGTQSFARRLERAGVARSRLRIVGYPVFDELVAPPVPPPGRFLYALQGLPWEEQIVRDLLEIFADKPSAALVLKGHPQLAFPAWLRRLPQPPNVQIAGRNVPLVEILRDTRCVIAQTSRMLFEAAVIERNVIVPHYDAAPLCIDLAPNAQRRVLARSAAELERRVQQVLGGRGYSLSRSAVAPDYPAATERTVEVLDRLLSSVALKRVD